MKFSYEVYEGELALMARSVAPEMGSSRNALCQI